MNKEKWFFLLGASVLLASMAFTVSATLPVYAQGNSRTFPQTGKLDVRPPTLKER